MKIFSVFSFVVAATSTTLNPFLLQGVSGVQCGKWYSKACFAKTDVRYDESVSYNLQDQAAIWNRLDGFYEGRISYLYGGMDLQENATFQDPQALFPELPFDGPHRSFLNITMVGSRAIFQVVETHMPANPAFCSLSVPAGMTNTVDGQICGDHGLAAISVVNFVSTYNKDGSALSLPDPSFLGQTSKAMAVDEHTWFGSVREKDLFVSISAKCVDDGCDHYASDTDYFLIQGDASDLIYSKKVRYDRIDTKEQFVNTLNEALDESQIEPSAKRQVDLDAPCIRTAVRADCVTEDEWCDYDPVCKQDNPFQEPDSSLKPSFIAAIAIVSIAIVAFALYALFKRNMRKQEERFKRHFAQQIAKSIQIEGSAKTINMTPEVLIQEFQKIDITKDGQVSKEELWAFLQTEKAGKIRESDFNVLFESMDTSGDGMVDFIEFCAFLGKIDKDEFVAANGGAPKGRPSRQLLAQASVAILKRVEDDALHGTDSEMLEPLNGDRPSNGPIVGV